MSFSNYMKYLKESNVPKLIGKSKQYLNTYIFLIKIILNLYLLFIHAHIDGHLRDIDHIQKLIFSYCVFSKSNLGF